MNGVGVRLLAGVCAALAAAPMAPASANNTCEGKPLAVQVLGSGGPELIGARASSAYLIRIQGVPRVLVDIGGGAALRFGESGARVADLDVILLTHLHADHTADLPALIKSSYFEDRKAPLPLFGPSGNKFAPGTVTFVRSLFDRTRGAYRYLSDFISPQNMGTYKLRPLDIEIKSREIVKAFGNERIRATAVPVRHGPMPALAWRVQVGDKAFAFSGDTDGNNGALERLAAGAEVLIAHHAIAEGAGGVERQLHMPPSTIGRIAQAAGVKRLVLSHRMQRTLGHESESLQAIRKHYTGPVEFADDLACYEP